MRLVSVLVLLVALGLCTGAAFAEPKGQVDERPFSYDYGETRAVVPELEPNDTCPTGQIVQCGDVVDPAQIASGTDLDWYTIQNVAGGTVITVGTDASTITPTPGLTDSFIELWYNCGAARVAYDDDSGPGAYSLLTYTVPAGSPGTYTVKVRGYSASYTGFYKVSISCQIPQPPPVNDLCSGAIVLERCTTGSVNGDLTWAANDYNPAVPGPSCTGGAAVGKDVTYRVDLLAGDTVQLTYNGTPNAFDGAIYIVSDCANVSATCVAGADTYPNPPGETINWVVVDSGTYYIICDAYGTNAGRPFVLTYNFACVPPAQGACCDPVTGACSLTYEANCLAPSVWHGEWISCDSNPCPQPPPPPENDRCEGAILLPQCGPDPLLYSGDAAWAVNDYSPVPTSPICTGYSAAGRDVVYKLILTAGDTFTVSYTRATVDASIYLVTDCANPGTSCVAGADDTFTGGTETFTFTSDAGGTYYLILDAYTTNGGGLWTMTYTPPLCPPVVWACCLPDGTCQMLSQAACATGNGVWMQDVNCDTNPCPVLPTGSCCYSDGTCAVTTQFACAAPATWTLDGACEPQNPCPQPTGSCCSSDGGCLLTTLANCAPPAIWTLGAVCEPQNPCPPPPATGACCNTTTGACTPTTQADCIAPLVWRGADVPCNLQTCSPATPVERTSWGQIKNTYR